VLECDRLAAMPFGDKAVAKGPRIEQIDAIKAVPACRKAVAQYPGSLRLKFQLGRALVRNGDMDEGMALMRESADKGYAAAMLGMAHMLYTG
jgi:predicted Zn-dependent protease